MFFRRKNNQKTRWYVIRLANQYSEEASLSLFGGLSPKEKSFSSIKEEGEKASRTGYHRLLLAWNFVFHSEREKLVNWILAKPQFFALQVHHKSFKTFKTLFKYHTKKINLFKYNNSIQKPLIDLLLEDYDIQLLEEVENQPCPFQITIPAHRGLNLNQLSEDLSKRYKNTPAPPPVYFHFPCYHREHPLLYNSEEMYQFLKKSFYPPPPIDIYNLSIPEDLDLEPEREPELSYLIPGSRPLASVIIPAYNCVPELSIVLKHLSQQDMPKHKWEVIVVDDGSESRMAPHLKNLDFLSDMNFKILFLPVGTHKTNNPMEHRFRAGIARNLGAQQAQGKFLLFLDSDILIPPFYVSSACRQLKTEDVIQHPRYHLIQSAPKNYSQIDKRKHTFVKGKGYWENFYNTAQDWNKKNLSWKYISTNTLCLKSSVFNQVGRFRKNYTCYGFEDTDLGYRLYQAGFRFKLNPVDTYHLFRQTHSDSDILKQQSLGFSANIFFHNNHCLEGYEEFRHLIPNI